MSKYSLRRCKDLAEWDRFVDISPQENIFVRSAVLAAMPELPDLWLLDCDNVPAAGAILFSDNRECRRAQQPRAWYQGILFGRRSANIHSWVRSQLEISAALLDELAKNYRSLGFCLHHSLDDIRSFLWFNYSNPGKGKFIAAPQYTAIIDLLDFENYDVFLKTIRSARREDLKKALRAGFVAVESTDIKAYAELEARNLFRGDDAKRYASISSPQGFVEVLLRSGHCRLLLANDHAGRPIAGVVFLQSRETAYYYASAVELEWRRSGVSTFLVLEAIRRAWQDGVRRIDMLGVNSPLRGDFKTSFNAKPVVYFNMSWQSLD